MKEYEDYLNSVCDASYDRAKPFIDIIRRNLVCPTCHGKYHNDKCLYCDKENEDIKEAISHLEDIIQSFNEKTKNLPIKDISFNKFFNLLYSLDNIEIDCINQLLEQFQYNDLMQKYYENLNLSFDKKLNPKDIDIIETLIKRNDRDLDEIYDYVIYDILNNSIDCEKPVIDFETFKIMLQNMIVNIIKKISKTPNPTCEILPNQDFNFFDTETHFTSGEAIADNIKLNELSVKRFYEYGNTAFLSTIYHELRHIYQHYVMLQGKEISPLGILMAKDTVLRDYFGPSYVKENYHNLSYEKDAFIMGEIARLNYLASLGFVANNKDKSLKYIADLQAKLMDKTRVIDGEKYDIDLLFAFIISKNPKYLDLYPILKKDYFNEEKNSFGK